MILVAFAVLALILANIPQTAGVYHHLLESHLTVGFDHFRLSKPLEAWINDGLMVIFFFYVGLEIKREIIAGQLSGVRRAALPVAAAIGGMAVPALIYVLINRSGDFLSGWGIPMATDIAFAIGILSLLGNRVPVSLKVFLMALAVVDDLGGILVIAVFYSTDIQVGMLVVAAVVFVFMILLKRLNVYKMRYYLILSIVMWILFLYSGIHATIAGVLIALTIPSTPRFTKRYFSYKTRYYLRSFRRHDRYAEMPELCRLLPGVVKTVFAQRRKQMGKVLGQNYGKEKAAAALAAVNLPPEIRPDKLAVDQFAVLTRALFALD